jgi:hypothetical protein
VLVQVPLCQRALERQVASERGAQILPMTVPVARVLPTVMDLRWVGVVVVVHENAGCMQVVELLIKCVGRACNASRRRRTR